MLNEEQWKNDANARKELEEALNLPIVRNALAIVSQHGLLPIGAPAGVDLIHYGAMKGYFRDGYFAAIEKLQSLTRVTSRKTEKAEPWKVNKEDMPEEMFVEGKSAPHIPTLAELQKEGLQPNPEPTP